MNAVSTPILARGLAVLAAALLLVAPARAQTPAWQWGLQSTNPTDASAARGTAATLRLPAPTLEPRTATLADALGREVRHLPVPARATSATLDLASLAPGLYMVRCGAALGKLMVE